MVIDILIVVAVVWLFAASFTDLKKREVSDWLSFSLIAIALSIRSAESIIQWDPVPILTSLSGLVVFFIIAMAMYYGKLFAGGDVKLLTALGAVIPSFSFLSNILIAGSVYGLVYSLVLALINFKDFYSELRKNKKLFLISLLLSLLFFAGYAITSNIFILLILVSALAITLILIFVNSVEKSCLIKKVNPSKLTEGDWLLKDVKVRGNVVKASFEGLTRKEIAMIKASGKKVFVKYGIPFIPVFLMALLITVFFGNIFMIFI
ncbi:MAG: A24 family peptidase [Nanoarchaeota archaeon]|nr:A24 family peptidase [Nanoarchaeota archaeon]